VYRCHEDSKFHLLFSLRERKARNATAAVAATTTTTTTTRRDGFFHTARTRHLSRACDILIKCDDTPRSIQTERVHTLASCDPSSAFHPPTPVDISDITSRVFRPRIHTSISLPLFLLYFKSQSFPRASPLPRRGTILVESLLSFFFWVSNERQRDLQRSRPTTHAKTTRPFVNRNDKSPARTLDDEISRPFANRRRRRRKSHIVRFAERWPLNARILVAAVIFNPCWHLFETRVCWNISVIAASFKRLMAHMYKRWNCNRKTRRVVNHDIIALRCT